MTSGNFISVKSIADRLLMNPIMKDLNFEFIVDKTVECLRLVNMPPIYVPGKAYVKIKNFRGDLPQDMIYLEQAFFVTNGDRINHLPSNFANNFAEVMMIANNSQDLPAQVSLIPMTKSTDTLAAHYNCLPGESSSDQMTFTLTNNKIYTNIEECVIFLAYKGIAVDEECFPLIPDNIKLIRAIESYIKYRWFDILNDMDKVTDRKLAKAESDYCWNIGQAQADMIMPDLTEMEEITNSITKMLPNTDQFKQRMKFVGSREYLKTQ